MKNILIVTKSRLIRMKPYTLITRRIVSQGAITPKAASLISFLLYVTEVATSSIRHSGFLIWRFCRL